jgi:hypothetical protein
MWNKVERFVLVTGLYDYLLDPELYSNQDIDWQFLVENCLYSSQEISLESVINRYEVFLNNQDYYFEKIKKYLQNFQVTPQIVIAILLTFFIEVDESLAINNDSLNENFLGKYPRITQELIAGEYTSLVNAIIRKVSVDYKLNFETKEELIN